MSQSAQPLDTEEAERAKPLGRALDLGCGRGQYAPELVRRGWEVVGIDYTPRAIEEARRQGIAGATFMVGDGSTWPWTGSAPSTSSSTSAASSTSTPVSE
jgi:SAM-dependent methyltransferase